MIKLKLNDIYTPTDTKYNVNNLRVDNITGLIIPTDTILYVYKFIILLRDYADAKMNIDTYSYQLKNNDLKTTKQIIVDTAYLAIRDNINKGYFVHTNKEYYYYFFKT